MESVAELTAMIGDQGEARRSDVEHERAAFPACHFAAQSSPKKSFDWQHPLTGSKIAAIGVVDGL